jgi:hypothetical protein
MQGTTTKIQHAHPTSCIVYKLDRKHRGKAVVWLAGCWVFITYVGQDSLAAVAPASVGKKTTVTIALLEVAPAPILQKKYFSQSCLSGSGTFLARSDPE